MWRDHPQARSGLEEAIIAIAEYELAVGEPRTALQLLGELHAPPPPLLARVREAAEEETRRLAALERFRRRHDYRTGALTRTFVIAALGLVFTAAPVIAWLDPDQTVASSHRNLIVTSLVMLAAVVGLGWWGRESMMKTAINQRALGSGVFLFVIQALLLAGYEQLGISVVATQVVLVGLWLSVTGMMAIAIDFRLAPGAAGYAMGFAIASSWPEARYPVMTICNLAFSINAVLCWRSDRWRQPPATERNPPRA